MEYESVMAATPVSSYKVTAIEEDERLYDVVPDSAWISAVVGK